MIKDLKETGRQRESAPGTSRLLSAIKALAHRCAVPIAVKHRREFPSPTGVGSYPCAWKYLPPPGTSQLLLATGASTPLCITHSPLNTDEGSHRRRESAPTRACGNIPPRRPVLMGIFTITNWD
ncbi:MAG TPA: hypothetical protein VJ440_06930 [Candidatus Brocadiaceae bacterium]|nr:hypothetical protein [Candidatus Brocadiaceae bacterium]